MRQQHLGMDEWSYQEMYQKFMESIRTMQIKSNKEHSIKRLKSFGATVFDGLLGRKKSQVSYFSTPKETEGWWKSMKARRKDTDTIS